MGTTGKWESVGTLQQPRRKIAFEGGLYDKARSVTEDLKSFGCRNTADDLDGLPSFYLNRSPHHYPLLWISPILKLLDPFRQESPVKTVFLHLKMLLKAKQFLVCCSLCEGIPVLSLSLSVCKVKIVRWYSKHLRSLLLCQVIPVEIDSASRGMLFFQLGVNRGDDPKDVATAFCQKHSLGPE